MIDQRNHSTPKTNLAGELNGYLRSGVIKCRNTLSKHTHEKREIFPLLIVSQRTGSKYRILDALQNQRVSHRFPQRGRCTEQQMQPIKVVQHKLRNHQHVPTIGLEGLGDCLSASFIDHVLPSVTRQPFEISFPVIQRIEYEHRQPYRLGKSISIARSTICACKPERGQHGTEGCYRRGPTGSFLRPKLWYSNDTQSNCSADADRHHCTCDSISSHETHEIHSNPQRFFLILTRLIGRIPATWNNFARRQETRYAHRLSSLPSRRQISTASHSVRAICADAIAIRNGSAKKMSATAMVGGTNEHCKPSSAQSDQEGIPGGRNG